MKRTLFIIGLTLLLALTITVRAFAGGWAVITLDELPGQVGVNQPLEIGFMVRQHGVTPMKDLTPQIHANLPGTTQYVDVTAQAQGKTGHYVGLLTLPEAGDWQWSIEAFTMNQAMPALTVVSAGATHSKTSIIPSSGYVSLAIGLLAALIGILFLKDKKHWAIPLVLTGLIAGALGAISAANPATITNVAQSPSVASSKSQVELGRELFIAKGCVTCHYHEATAKDREFGVDIGPNLTNFTASPDYLEKWLFDPPAIKPATKMPQLNLSEAEIQALIAFINAK